MLLIKSNLGCLLRAINIFVKGAVCIMTLLLYRCTKLHQVLWYGLVRGFEDVDQPKKKVSSVRELD